MGLAGLHAVAFSASGSVSGATSGATPTIAGEDEETYLDQPIELDQFEDGGNDDQEATDLVVGEEIDLLGESSGDNDPIELDLGTIVGLDDDQSKSDGEDERESSFEEDPSAGLAEPDPLTPDDGSEGLEDGSITVDESKFPALEMDDGSEGIAAEREISLGTASDEARVPMAALLWQALHPVTALEACSALAASAEAIVAASSDLLWFRDDSNKPLRVAVDGSALSDLVLVGPDRDIALASTRSGQLFRRARFASQAEQLTRFREQLRSQGSRLQLAFGGSLGAPNGRVLLLVNDGTLLEVLDAGDRFERVELDGKVLSVARESSTILLGRERARVLLTLDGGTSSVVSLEGAALAVAQSSAPLLATAGTAVAVAERGRAILVSPDQGLTFRRVAGSANTTAIAGALLDDNARFFAAVYRETSDQTDILSIDPTRAEAACIAQLDGSVEHTSSDAIERGEWAKVTALHWHAPSGRLWATGGFGVISFGPTSA